jgi:preprotein translocase subunit SecF|tara:strand:- start:882 stop:1322 length:441 start_codon:yes stop_codon:yes gene_type:complete
MKLSIGLGIALLLVVSGSYVLIGNLNDEIAILKGNAIVLEGEVQRQNEQIKKNLAQQQKTYAQIDSLTKKNQENMREVNALKQTFARHDLDALAMAKPKLLESKVNRATKRVFDGLIELTDPSQFDDKPEEPEGKGKKKDGENVSK